MSPDTKASAGSAVKYPAILWSAVIILLTAVDQITKYLASSYLELNERVDVIPGIINFRFIKNPGAAWGMFADNRWVFIAITSVALIILPIVLYKYRRLHFLFGTSMSLIIAGGIGNMIDRLAYGEVTDFIEFSFFSFPVFNFADMCVTCGAVALLVYIIFIDKTFFADKGKPENDATDK